MTLTYKDIIEEFVQPTGEKYNAVLPVTEAYGERVYSIIKMAKTGDEEARKMARECLEEMEDNLRIHMVTSMDDEYLRSGLRDHLRTLSKTIDELEATIHAYQIQEKTISELRKKSDSKKYEGKVESAVRHAEIIKRKKQKLQRRRREQIQNIRRFLCLKDNER